MTYLIRISPSADVSALLTGTLQEITETYPRIARAIWKDTLVDAAVFREWPRDLWPEIEVWHVQLPGRTILERDFTMEDNELTPSMKTKNRVVVKNWADKIAYLFDEKSAGTD